MFKFVETQKTTYLCENVIEEGAKMKLEGAMELGEEDKDSDDLAKMYLKAKLLDKLRTISLAMRSFESQEDADEVGPLIELMMKYVPMAEKKARARGILQEVAKLAGIDSSELDD